MTKEDEMEYGEIMESLQELINQTRENCTPLPDDFFDKFSSTEHGRQIGVSAAFGIICAAGLIANIIVIFLLLTGGRKGATFEAPSTILIMNLAIADTLFLLTLPFSISHRLHKSWKFGPAMCKFEEGVKFLNYYGSVFFITAMAVDRYLVVCRPAFLNRQVARKYMCITSVVLWFLAIVAVIPLLKFAGVDDHGFCSIMFPRGPTVVHNSSKFTQALYDVECVEDFMLLGDDYYEGTDSEIIQSDASTDGAPDYIIGSGSEDDYFDYIDDNLGVTFEQDGMVTCKHPNISSLQIWLVWNFIIGFVVPFFIISLCYVRLMMMKMPVISLTRERPPTASDSANNNGPRSSNRISINLREDVNKLISSPDRMNSSKYTSQRAKILMNVLVPCLIAAFAICWLPYHLFHLLQINGVNMTSLHACRVTSDVTFCLAFFNSALNPILNSFFLYNFKQRVRESSNWVSSQLKNISIKRKPDKDGSAYVTGTRQDEGNTVALETTMMTSVAGVDDDTNA